MRLVIKSADGRILGVWVARTSKGFNKEQRKQIAVRTYADIGSICETKISAVSRMSLLR